MRIARDFTPGLADSDPITRTSEAGRRARPSAAQSTSGTADLVSLSFSLQAVTGYEDSSREVAVNALKQAYESGAIRPNPGRLAGTLLRLAFDSRGEA